jgi:penicillin amidase
MSSRSVLRLSVAALLFLLIIGTSSAQLTIPLPQHSGELSVPGLNDTVEILRDSYGVPHIYASSIYDLFFAQGFTQAQDRWWQMEFSRHTTRGSIQELTGRSDSLMGTDVFLRTLGLRQVTQQEIDETLSDDSVAILQAFADGVNAYILSRPASELAIEYNLLGLNGITIEIEPWSPVDSLMWGKIMAYSLSGNQDIEQLFSVLYAELPEDMMADFLPEWPFGERPTIVQPEDLAVMEETASLDTAFDPGAGIAGLETTWAGGFETADLEQVGIVTGPSIGSNNWVAGGSNTESGLPLMANDMHLGHRMPSIWYEIGLHCAPVTADCPYDVTGFTFSPTPGVTAGHNARISWAFTNVGPDTQDLYLIRVNPENPLQYEYNGEWRDMTVREETLNFGDGSEPVTFQVRITHFGPIINDNARDAEGNLTGFNNENPVALRWTSLEPGSLLDASLGLNRAQNWDDFRAALTMWDSPSQNVIYADVDGNIGYQMPGRIPIRAPGHTGMLPVEGWTDTYEWRGYIPYESLPRIFNPERGYVISANQAVVPLEYYDALANTIGDEFGADSNYVISRLWDYGYRGTRINQLMVELAPHTPETFAQMHGDNFDGSAAEIVPLLADVTLEDSALADRVAWLQEWDFQADIDSAHAAYYAMFWRALVQQLYNDQFGDLYSANGTQNEWRSVYLLWNEPDNVWWDDVTTPDGVETRDDIVARALQQGYDDTVAALGEDETAWIWGALHTTTFVSDPLGQSGVPLAENLVNRGPFPTSGTRSAINANDYSIRDFSVSSGPSERVIYDLSDWDNSRSIHITGQSGHPQSDQYDDMIDEWLNIQYRPMVFTREAVEGVAVNTLILTPAD